MPGTSWGPDQAILVSEAWERRGRNISVAIRTGHLGRMDPASTSGACSQVWNLLWPQAPRDMSHPSGRVVMRTV